jgi:hypothetical protein
MNVSFNMGRRDQSISEKDRDRDREQTTDDDLKTNFQISKAQRDRGNGKRYAGSSFA